jgi:indole-3-glycerol phosphate synthase
MSKILQTIMPHKREEIAQAKAQTSLRELEEKIKSVSKPRGFLKALQEKRLRRETGIIAEIKKASPSKGLIRADFDPAVLAHAYEEGGAACISVLTDKKFFQGASEFLSEARKACSLPVLRKDFLCDTYQVIEARALGADCILIILVAVDDAIAQDLLHAAHELHIDALVEVHTENEMQRALKLGAQMIGINNRNLNDFTEDLTVSERLASLAPQNTLLVSASAISSRADIDRLNKCGITTFLIGETLMREKNVTEALRKLI